MARSHDEVDFASVIPNVTDFLGDDTPPVASSPPAGFTLNRVKMGLNPVLVKVFSGIPQGSLTSTESKAIAIAFLRELGSWRHRFHSEYFVQIIGQSEYVDSVLPSPVYSQTILAREYFREQKNPDVLGFVKRITEGIEILHRNNVVHGDIRSDNILVGSDGLPCISDYGLTRIVCLLDKHGYRGMTDVTPAMRWMPPEFMNFEDDVPYNPSKQGDMWSLGMTIFELWSGNMPYLGTPLERVPTKIRRGQLPNFPGELRPALEQYRDHIVFLCRLCWQPNPTDRKTAAELVRILGELVGGKRIPSVSKPNDTVRVSQVPLPKSSNGYSLASGASSISSSDTSSSTSSRPAIIEVRSIVSPSEGSDSGHETYTEQDRTSHRKTTVKMEDVDENSTISGWSHLDHPQRGNTDGPSPFQAARNVPTNGQGVPPRQPRNSPPSPMPFSAIPSPPAPDAPLNSVSSWMTALLNYKAKHKVSLIIERESSGEDHQPLFTTTCKIAGRVYALVTEHKKKFADEKAAQDTLMRLYDENPSLASESTPSYLSTFRSYLAQHGLTSRIEWREYKGGEDHNPIWTCIVLRDGEELSRAEAAKKYKAVEEAAKRAAELWSSG